MIESTQYKEITCDLCGKKTKFDTMYEFPYCMGYHRIVLYKTANIYDVCDVCEDCFKRIVEYIEEYKDIHKKPEVEND